MWHTGAAVVWEMDSEGRERHGDEEREKDEDGKEDGLWGDIVVKCKKFGKPLSNS